MAKRTTINIDTEVRKALQECRKYPRETYDDTLKRLIKNKELHKKASMKGGLNRK